MDTYYARPLVPASDERYPLQSPIVRIGDVRPDMWPSLKSALRDLVSGPINFEVMPEDGSSHLMVFENTSFANKALATLNDHPYVRKWGAYFCAPGDAGCPRLDKIFTTRILKAETCVVPRGSRPRSEWMDTLHSSLDLPAPWPEDAPSPEDLYDECSAFGEVFSIIVRPTITGYGSPWTAKIQYYDPADAERLESNLVNSPIRGWQVSCTKVHHEAHRDEIQARLAIFRARLASLDPSQIAWISTGPWEGPEQPAQSTREADEEEEYVLISPPSSSGDGA